MNWSNLKAAISAVIKTNNNQEITGAILQNTLNSIVNSVGANATFAGVATPSTSPGTPDGPTFWLVGQGGQYSNFNNTTVSGGVLGVFLFDSNVWTFIEVINVQSLISSLLTQINNKIGNLTELETEDKTNLVNAINEVKNNASSTAQDTSYVDNQGLGSTNVQGALDVVADNIIVGERNVNVFRSTPNLRALTTFEDNIVAGNKYLITIVGVTGNNSLVSVSIGNSSTATEESPLHATLVTEGMQVEYIPKVNATHWRMYVQNYKCTINVKKVETVKAKEELSNIKDLTLPFTTNCYDHTKSEVSSNHATLVIEKTETGFTVTSSASGSGRYANLLIKGLEIGVQYRLAFHYSIGTVSTATYPYNLTVRTNINATGEQLAGVVLQNLGLEGDINLEFTPTTFTTALRIANNDMANGNIEISNISIYLDKTIREAIEENDAGIDDIRDECLGFNVNFGNITGDSQVAFSEFTEFGCTTESVFKVTIDSTNEQILFDAVGTKQVRKYAWVKLPPLVLGQRYTVDILYDANINGDGWVGIYDVPEANTNPTLGGFTAVTGIDCSASFNFTAIYGNMYIRAASNATGGVGSYIHIKNIRIYPSSDVDYYSLREISDVIDEIYPNLKEATVVKYYKGEKIPKIGARYQIGYKKLFNNAGCQAGSAYGDYWFQFTNQHASVSIYDLRTGTLHSTVSMPSKATDHYNNACFSNIFYDASDTFPLIYTSGSQTASYNHVQVWRIQLIENVFTIEQVQEITLPTGSTENPIWYWGQAYLDNELGYMWYCPHDSHTAIYLKYEIPAIFDSDNNVISEVTLTEEDALDRFTAQRGKNQQGGAVHNGVLYLLDGVPAWGTLTKLLVIDLRQKRLINMIDIYHILGITAEFEGAGIYNDTLIVATNGAGVYAIYF